MRKLVATMVAALLLLCCAFSIGKPLVPPYLLPDAAAYPELEGIDLAKLRERKSELLVSFSHEDSFYDGDIDLALSAEGAAAIYYTLDGSTPTKESERYSGPLYLPAQQTACVVVKALAVGTDEESQVATRSYFIGEGASLPYETLVFSLSTDSGNLYNYDGGIFVDGRIRDEFMAQRPGEEAFWFFPSNLNLRGPESERPVTVEVFDESGQRVVAQNAGMRVHGGGTRQYPQKSLRLIARSDYEGSGGRFEYNFFPDDATSLYGTPIISYDTLLLRNGGNDRYQAMLRNELANRLARQAGMEAVSSVRPAAVFLNGDFYGFTWLQQVVNEQALRDIYNAPPRTIEIVDGISVLLNEQGAIPDLTDDDVFEIYRNVLDIDELLFYYAFEMYLGNFDWPQNNVKLWRYSGSEDVASPLLDRRWRHVFFDAEYGLGFDDLEWDTPSLDYLYGMGDEVKSSPLLPALLEREELRCQFAAILCDIMNQHLAAANVEKNLNILWDEGGTGILFSLEHGVEPGYNTPAVLKASHREIMAFFQRRSTYIKDELAIRFGFSDEYTVKATGFVQINTQRSGYGRYYSGCSVPVNPVLEAGQNFDCWLLNGRRVYEETLIVSDKDAINGVVDIQLLTTSAPLQLAITDVLIEEGINECCVVNTGTQPAALKGLFFTDNPNNLQKWAFPSITLAPGQTLPLAGEPHTSADALLKLALNFKISAGETLILSNKQGDVLAHRPAVADTPAPN